MNKTYVWRRDSFFAQHQFVCVCVCALLFKSILLYLVCTNWKHQTNRFIYFALVKIFCVFWFFSLEPQRKRWMPAKKHIKWIKHNDGIVKWYRKKKEKPKEDQNIVRQKKKKEKKKPLNSWPKYLCNRFVLREVWFMFVKEEEKKNLFAWCHTKKKGFAVYMRF